MTEQERLLGHIRTAMVLSFSQEQTLIDFIQRNFVPRKNVEGAIGEIVREKKLLSGRYNSGYDSASERAIETLSNLLKNEQTTTIPNRAFRAL